MPSPLNPRRILPFPYWSESHKTLWARQRDKTRDKRDSTPASVIAAQIVSAALAERVSVADLGELAKSDAAFGMRVLVQVNSGVKDGGRRIADLDQADGMLGIRGMNNIALGLALSQHDPGRRGRTTPAGEFSPSRHRRRRHRERRRAQSCSLGPAPIGPEGSRRMSLEFCPCSHIARG